MVILEIKELTKDFLGLRAVNNVSLDVKEKEIFGLIGPNGSGKTTLFNLITGFYKPTEGSISYKGQIISGKEPYEIAKLGLLRTFQLVNLFPNLTVEQNIIAGCHLISTDSFIGSFFYNKGFRNGINKINNRTKEILEFLNLSKYKNVIAKSLPLGEERKLELAIALASNPSFLLLDEQWAGMMRKELDAGSWKVIAEARESGTIGIYRKDGSANLDLIEGIIKEVEMDDVLWEAPIKSQQAWFIQLLGANVNLGNIAPNEVVSLESLRLGLRGDTFFTFLPEEYHDRKL